MRELDHPMVLSVASQAEQDRGVLDGPHAAEVVAERVVRGIARRQRADAPAAEQVWLEQPAHEPRHVLVADDAGGQTVPGVRRHGADLPLVRVEAEGDAAFVPSRSRG